MGERLVIGSSYAALVAADGLAAAGHAVRLFLPGASGVGGGFAGIPFQGRVLELGVRLLELSYDNEVATPALSAYQPGPTGHRPYAGMVSDYLHGLVAGRLVAVDRPQMYFQGAVQDDLYFTTDATVLARALGAGDRTVVRDETARASSLLGPAGLLGGDLGVRTLAEASLANHGARFHELFIAPVAEKVMTNGCRDTLATLRRKIWLPLFWPETLSQACGNEPVGFLPNRPLHTVADGGAGEVVACLLERLHRRGVQVEYHGSLVCLGRGEAGSTVGRMADGESFEAIRPVIGTSATQLFHAVGGDYQPQLARTVICWLEVADNDLTDAPSVLTFVDPDLAALRISTGGLGQPGHTVLTVELRCDLPENQIRAAAGAAVEQAGLVRAGATVHALHCAANSTFPLPTLRNCLDFEAGASRLAEMQLEIEIVGPAMAFGADALGEQIIQGLRATEVLT